MVYPLYYGEIKFSMVISGLDPYFTKFGNPALWHPNHFAIQPSAYSTDSFIDGLEKIGARGKGSIPTYAKKCVRFLKTAEGKRVLTHANDVLQLRLQNQRKTFAEKQLLLGNDQALYDNLTEQFSGGEEPDTQLHDDVSCEEEDVKGDEDLYSTEGSCIEQQFDEVQEDQSQKHHLPKTLEELSGQEEDDDEDDDDQEEILDLENFATRSIDSPRKKRRTVKTRLLLSPLHSFMVDIDDRWLKKKFEEEDWREICSKWPKVSDLPESVKDYIQTFEEITDLEGMSDALRIRPEDVDQRIVHRCLEDWLDIFKSEPSPFTIAASLSESYWQNEAWGFLRKLTNGVPDCIMLPGDVAGIESKKRQNRKKSGENNQSRVRMGKRGDIFWRSFHEPAKDWAVVEAAKTWDPFSTKYITESTSKLPRQLHDILMSRTDEVGGSKMMRSVVVPGLIIG
ncbi:hypothetical protein BG011_001271, partial [Mortierella polycephala]